MEIFACCILLSVVAASNFSASSSTVPLNDSALIVPCTNDSSERPDYWPPLPFIYPVEPGLSISMTEYGDLTPLPQEEVVLAVLVGIVDQIATGGGSEDEISTTDFYEHGILVSFQRPRSPTLPFRRWEAAKAIHTVRRLMFTYEPRSLPLVNVFLGEEMLSQFSIKSLIRPNGIPSLPLSLVSNNSEPASADLTVRSNASPSWPPGPYTFYVGADLLMTIFDYGPGFTISKQDVLTRLSNIEAKIQQMGGPDELLPSVIITSGPVTVIFAAVRFPDLPLTYSQAAQVIRAISGRTQMYGPRKIARADVGVVGRRAMLFSLRSPIRATGNETSFLTLGPSSNDSTPTSPALVARSNMTLSNTKMAIDKDWPPLPFTFNVEDNLDVTVLEYGATFPGPRRNLVNALAVIADTITKSGQPSSIMRTKQLSHSPAKITFSRITGQGVDAPRLLRSQATMVLDAIGELMQDHKPRELTRTEISVDGVKAMALSLQLYFATVDSGNTTMEIGNAAGELGSASADIGTS